MWTDLSADMVGDILAEYYGKKDPMTTTNMLCNKLRDLNQDEKFDDTTVIISALSGFKKI